MPSLQASETTGIPAHVPANAVLPFDPWSDMEFRPHEALDRVRSYGAVVYSPRHHIAGFAPNGCWMITQASVARKILLDPLRFSSQHTTGIPQALEQSFTLAPIEADPPLHTAARAALNPLFSPKAVRPLDGKIRTRTNDLIDRALARGEIDFVHDFAKVLPSEIFLDLMGLPHDRIDDFLRWEEMIMGATDMAVRIAGLRAVAEYLRGEVRERIGLPRDDMLSIVSNSERNGQKLTEDEALGTAILLYIAGLDTVVNALCWQFRHLAEHLDDQRFLRENPAAIAKAVEELLRAYSMISLTRIVTEDLDFEGITMKRGDVVSVPTPLASRDPAEYDDGGSARIDRGASRHLAFGFGPHICLGMHLARIEMIAAIELWLERVPEFRIKDGAAVKCQGGAVLAVITLPLIW